MSNLDHMPDTAELYYLYDSGISNDSIAAQLKINRDGNEFRNNGWRVTARTKPEHLVVMNRLLGQKVLSLELGVRILA